MTNQLPPFTLDWDEEPLDMSKPFPILRIPQRRLGAPRVSSGRMST